jgi:hypothetical protein
MMLRCCNGTYTRDREGWRYPWGARVPGARDLTLTDLLTMSGEASCVKAIEAFRPLTDAERRWLAGDRRARDDVVLRRNGPQAHVDDLIVTMLAPELHVLTMMTVGDIAQAAGVTKATIDSYRYRGSLPAPQVVRGRTPLWSRPIVRRWLASRPGAGWRTDLYPGPAERRRRPERVGPLAPAHA